MRSIHWILLPGLLVCTQAFSLTDECGVEWNTTLTRRMGVSPFRAVIVSNAIEVEPNHWVSNDPKGGSLYFNFGQDTGEVFARQSSGFFQWRNAIVTKDLIDQWKVDSAPLSFNYKINVGWSFRALPSFQGIHQFNPNQRNYVSPTELGCRSRAGWTDADGKSWSQAIRDTKGDAFWKTWLKQWAMRPDKVEQVPNMSSWSTLMESYTVDFDPAMCDTHLGAAFQVSYWRELYLDDWRFDVYQAPDPSVVNTCPK